MNTQIQHVGRFNSRCSDGSPSGDREAAFIRLWQEENNPPDFLNHGLGVLCWLLHARYDAKGYTFDREEATQEEATAAATVIQWLGTNCGWDFLTNCVQACGYELVRKPKPPEAA